jgi:beta-lactamase class A
MARVLARRAAVRLPACALLVPLLSVHLPVALVMAVVSHAIPFAQAPQATPLHAELGRQLDARLRAVTASFDGVLGYSVIDLTSGERRDALSDAVFPAASTIKVAILYELYRQVDARRIRLDEALRLERRHAVGGSGVLFELDTPTLSVRDYATLMIVLSDNTATNVVIEGLGMTAINETLDRWGLGRTRLRRRMMDLEAARKGEENVTSPRELARLLEILWKGEGLSRSSRDEAIAIMTKSKTTPIVRGVPPGTPVAGKSGELDGVRADAAIVSAPGRPYILAVMTTFAKNDLEAERTIEDVSRAAWLYFSRVGSGGSFGRRVDN